MKKSNRLETRIPVLLCVLAVALCYWVPGCAHFRGKQSAAELEAQRDAAIKWNEGFKAFEEGDYETSAEIFDSLSRQAEDEALRRRALYAAACSHLLGSRTAREFDQALETWKLWKEMAPYQQDFEDPRMLDILLQRHATCYKEAQRSRQRLKPHNEAALRKRLEEKDKEITELKQRLDALETLHREIQEKKKGVSSP
ncbi:hypothetical protein [Desulfoglaeba alkanexedens]|uniref:Uncharacterized protein n=1 Tax=Desulfoglaeba alkanexedens ALDC TaxID=980445 RepID=A0A4P8L4H6_9BACT|nr:hypothetical protein [Desulfoglaeba alkanexedens]QCQ22790.1 hypothetical protein FDQ92_11765 [Desulfoglaeba alkanexedens ALDC]